MKKKGLMSDWTRQKRSHRDEMKGRRVWVPNAKDQNEIMEMGYKVTPSVTSARRLMRVWVYISYRLFVCLFACLFGFFEPKTYNKQHFIHNEREIWKNMKPLRTENSPWRLSDPNCEKMLFASFNPTSPFHFQFSVCSVWGLRSSSTGLFSTF